MRYIFFSRFTFNVLLIFCITSFSTLAQQRDTVYTIHDFECFPSITSKKDTCVRTFFATGNKAEALICQKRKKFQKRVFILKIDEIEGVKEKVRIQLCEGAGNPMQGFEGLGCWTNFKKRKAPISIDKKYWGIFIHIHSAISPEKKIIRNKSQELLVLEFINSL